MTIIIEVNKPFQKKPGYYKSNLMKRVWWLYFAITFTWAPLDHLLKNKFEWEDE